MEPDKTLYPPLSRGLFWSGVATCVLFAIVAVVARGVRWDETWEHAQIIAGQVTYPPGHPLAVYVHNAFSFQTYLSAALVKLGLGPGLVCGFRNILFLLASMLPVYALTTLLTRSVLAGMLATLLLLQGVMLEFDGSYPTMVWPEIYSNGHIGGGIVLLALVTLIAGAQRSAWFLLGIIPCIHLGQWPPLAGTMALYAVYQLYRKTRRRHGEPPAATPWTTCTAMTLLGLGCTVLFYLIQREFMVAPPAEGAFAISGDVAAIWQGYTALHDPHRQFPPGNGHVILAGTWLLTVFSAFHGRTPALRSACAWLAVYCGVVASLVWGTMAIHAIYGPKIPFLLIAWMPYRLINHMPPLALALMAALIVLRWPLRGWWILGGAALAGVLLPTTHALVGTELAQRYLADGSWIAFGLYGAALLSIAPNRRRARNLVTTSTLLALGLLAAYHHFGAACIVTGIIATYFVTRRATREPVFVHPILVLPLLLLMTGSAALLRHQYENRDPLAVTPFEHRVAHSLPNKDGVLLLAPPDNIRLQATTGCAVLAEAATPSLISYVPEIGPSIDQLYRDLYGYSFVATEGDTPSIPWDHLWQERSTAQWQALADAYGFTHVVAPAAWSLNLSPVLAEEDYALYAVEH